MEDVDNTIFIERDKMLICNSAVVDDDTDKTIVPGFYRVHSAHNFFYKWWMFDKKIP